MSVHFLFDFRFVISNIISLTMVQYSHFPYKCNK